MSSKNMLDPDTFGIAQQAAREKIDENRAREEEERNKKRVTDKEEVANFINKAGPDYILYAFFIQNLAEGKGDYDENVMAYELWKE